MKHCNIHSSEIIDATAPFWDVLPILTLDKCTYKDLVHELLRFKLSQSKVGLDKPLGTALVDLQSFVTVAQVTQPKPFVAEVTDSQNKLVCTISGVLELQNLPHYAQLEDGYGTDNGVTGTPLLPGLPLPINWKQTL